MARSALLRLAGGVAALVAIAGCEGKVLRLGGGGVDGAGSCPHAQVSADQVLWIGDSWILNPGNQYTAVRDLARASGAIGSSDDYRNAAAPGATMAAIATQYATAEASATKVEVVIMDGGTWDTLTANGSSASVTTASNAFTQFLTGVATDGTVAHIIYFLPPELPNIPGVAALRTPVQDACAQSTVPCHFLDLQPLWAGHPEYTASDGFFPTSTGATVLADAIWAIMQTNCIAQ